MIIIKKINGTIKYITNEEIEDFLNYDIHISEIKKITIYSENSQFVERFPFPEGNYKIKINYCNLEYIPDNIPIEIQEINLSNNNFRIINLQNFNNLIKLKINNNRLSSIGLPPKIEELYINSNNLTNLYNIPESIHFIDICSNLLLSPLEIINAECQIIDNDNLFNNNLFNNITDRNGQYTSQSSQNLFNSPVVETFDNITNRNESSTTYNSQSSQNLFNSPIVNTFTPPLINNFFIDVPPNNIQEEYQPLLDTMGDNIPNYDMENLLDLMFIPFNNEINNQNEKNEIHDTDILEDSENYEKYKEKINKITNLIEQGKIKIPENFLCPISKSIFYNPVLLSDGYTYEKEYILKWIQNNNKSPMTNRELINKDISPNILVRSMVREWVDKINSE